METGNYVYISPMVNIPVVAGVNWAATIYSKGVFRKTSNGIWTIEYWACISQSSAKNANISLPASIVFGGNQSPYYNSIGTAHTGANALRVYGLAYNLTSVILWRCDLNTTVCYIHAECTLDHKPTGFVPDGV